MQITDTNLLANNSDKTYTLSNWLGAKREKVNEEELFSAIICDRLNRLRGGATATQFQTAVQDKMQTASQNKQRLGIEDASMAVLDDFVTKKIITKIERDTIVAQSFDAAQLDSNKGTLWDSLGGEGDSSVATSGFDAAVKVAQTALGEIDSGKRKASLATISSSRTSGAMTNFLFKPVSNSSGTASFLFPADVGKQAASVTLQDAQGNVIDTGRFTSFGENGQMAKYVFKKAGQAYPKDISVVITLRSGEVITVPISDPAKRSTTTK